MAENSVSHIGDTLEVNQQCSIHTQTSDLVRDKEEPKYPQYKQDWARLASFKEWPLSKSIPPELMVAAGLVFTGRGDSVRCYHCGGGLRNWEPGDDPWEEHAKQYPRCPYVLRVKGKTFIACVLRGEKPEPGGTSNKKQVETVPDDLLLRSEAALMCKTRGYSNEVILKAIKVYQEIKPGCQEFTYDDIFSIILELEETDDSSEDDVMQMKI